MDRSNRFNSRYQSNRSFGRQASQVEERDENNNRPSRRDAQHDGHSNIPTAAEEYLNLINNPYFSSASMSLHSMYSNNCGSLLNLAGSSVPFNERSVASPIQEVNELYRNATESPSDRFLNQFSRMALRDRHNSSPNMLQSGRVISPCAFNALRMSPTINPMFVSPTPRQSSRSHSNLPLWALDENKELRSDVTLEKIVDRGFLICFATDKIGCHFLQSNFFGGSGRDVSTGIRDKVCNEVLGNRDVFLTLCKNMFGNFFMQRVIENSRQGEQDLIRRHITSDITNLCLDKSACRVVQTALEKLKPRYAEALVDALPTNQHLMAICVDQNANHVIQKVVKKMSLHKWEFLVNFFCSRESDNLLEVCQDKYGCRVVQTVVEVLSVNESSKFKDESADRMRVLSKLMAYILSRCAKLASNEFANYVVQHIIETPGVLSAYRDTIIEKCLLRNILSMAQEKYASHVVERAFTYAPLPLLTEMMEEVFDGYVPHPDTGKDALDILIFHQFGNYVVQRMLQICCSAVLGQKPTIVKGVDEKQKFSQWLGKLYMRAVKEKHRLMRFSSGKKILEILRKMEGRYDFPDAYNSIGPGGYNISLLNDENHGSGPLYSASATNSADWVSRRTSFSSTDHASQDYDYLTQQRKYLQRKY